MKAIVWSITHIFSCCKPLSLRVTYSGKTPYMSPIEGAGLKVRGRTLHEDVRVKSSQPLFRVAKKVFSNVHGRPTANALAISRCSSTGDFLAIGRLQWRPNVAVEDILKNHINLDTFLCLAFQQSVQAVPILVWPPHLEF